MSGLDHHILCMMFRMPPGSMLFFRSRLENMLATTSPIAPPPRGIDSPTTLGLMFLALLFPPAESGAQTKVFRCTSASGEIEFSQHPCPAQTSSEELILKDRKTGWTPPRPKPRPAPKASPRDTGKQSSRTKESKQKDTDSCWKKQQQLEEVNWKLRSGYKPAKGTQLRRRRRAYEAYIDRYCR